MTTDEIALTIPPDESFHEVAHLVLGGVAARLNLTFESLDDLETALEALLERTAAGSEVTITLRLEEDAMRARVGPLTTERIRLELGGEPGDGVGLRRILDTVVDGFELLEDGKWVELTKRITLQQGVA
jgi:anti-sigma regulatory factor (Ser/Thr protein kinase)